MNDTVDVTHDYVYSGLNIIEEVSGGTHEQHIYTGGMHVASNTTGAVGYYHVDQLGSTRLKTVAMGQQYCTLPPTCGNVYSKWQYE